MFLSSRRPQVDAFSYYLIKGIVRVSPKPAHGTWKDTVHMNALLKLLIREGQFHTGKHFVYTSGRHGEVYVNLRFLDTPNFENDIRLHSYSLLLQALKAMKPDFTRPIVVVGVETLGAKMARYSVEEYNRRHSTRIRFAVLEANKHEDGSKSFVWSSKNPAINHLLQEDTQVIWMDDLLNTASTLKRTRQIIETFAPIMTVAVLFDRRSFSVESLHVPFTVSLIKRPIETFDPEVNPCPFCRASIPVVTNLGHGANWKKSNPAYKGGFEEV